MKKPAADLDRVLVALEALNAKVEVLAERQRASDELMAEMAPIAREAMATAIAKLDVLEQKGYFAFASEAVDLARRVIEGFSPADVRQLGESIVGMLETVRAITQPDVLDAKPIGMLGVARAARKDDVRKGLAVLMEMMRRLGQRAEAAAPPARAPDHKARLAAMLGPRRARLALPAAAAAAPARVAARAPACAAPSPTAAADPDWSRGKGEAVAADQGVALTDAHWRVIDSARADYAAHQVSPNLRRLTQITAVTTKDLYALFPKAPGRTIAAIAGLPKPAGCL